MAELLRATAEPTDIEVDLDGRPTSISVHVFNLSTIVDGYRVDAPGAPPWLRVEPGDVRLLPGTDGTATVTVAVPNGDGVPAHDAAVRLRVRSLADPHVARSIQLTVRVPETASDVGLELEPSMLRGERARSRLAIHNRAGNVPVRLHLRGNDAEGVVRFQFSPPQVQLGPGQTAFVDVQVAAPRVRAGESEQRRQLEITALDGQRSYTATATLVQQPPPTREPFPVRKLMAVVATLLGAALMFLGTFQPWFDSTSGANLTIEESCDEADDLFPLDCAQLGVIPDAVPSLLVSAGIVTVLLAVAAALGLIGTGALTRFAGIAAVGYVVLVFFAFTIVGAAPGLAGGAIVVMVGGVIAVIGGVLTRPA